MGSRGIRPEEINMNTNLGIKLSFNQRENLKNIEHALISDVYFTSNQARDKEHHRDEHL